MAVKTLELSYGNGETSDLSYQQACIFITSSLWFELLSHTLSVVHVLMVRSR